jgi:N-ATPase, AtpR subunit
MTDAPLFPIIGLAVTMTVAGFVFGLLYFAALERTVTLFAAGRGWFRPLGLTLARMAAAVIFLGVAAKLGAISLLAAFMGFLLARAVALRAQRDAR